MDDTFKTLRLHIGFLESNQPELLKRWLMNPAVKGRLNAHHINCEFFRDYFGVKVVAYALGVIRGENELGNCPVIGVMLMLFKKKNIPLNDVFVICVNLKNTLFELLLEEGLLSREMLVEAATLMDYNFEGVIKGYVQLYYFDMLIPGTCQISRVKEGAQASEEIAAGSSVQNTSSPVADVVSAERFAAEVEIEPELIDELNELEHDVLIDLDITDIVNAETFENVVRLFGQYAKTLNQLIEFDELSYTINVLCDLLRKCDFTALDKVMRSSMTIYLKAVLLDLGQWKDAVLVKRSAEDIHYLDKTLLSSIAQLEIILMPSEEGDDEAEIDFF